MAIDEIDVLYDMAQRVLDETVSTFEELELSLPDRRYVAIGGVEDVAHDCEQLTVTIEQHYPGTPIDQAEAGATCESPRTVAMSVELVRCVPNMQSKGGRGGVAKAPPSPDMMNAYAKTRARDMLVMLDVGATVSDKFFMDNGVAGGINMGGLFDVSPGAPSGNMQGVILNLVVILPTW